MKAKSPDCHPRRKHHSHGLCRTCYRNANREKHEADGQRAAHLRRKYGLTVAAYERLLKRQDGVCRICKEVCKTGLRLAVDHSHKEKKVRGLLCYNCNTKLGWFERHRRTIMEYLK